MRNYWRRERRENLSQIIECDVRDMAAEGVDHEHREIVTDEIARRSEKLTVRSICTLFFGLKEYHDLLIVVDVENHALDIGMVVPARRNHQTVADFIAPGIIATNHGLGGSVTVRHHAVRDGEISC